MTGYGAMLDVDIIEVDSRPIDLKVNPFTQLHFPSTNPTAMTTRRLKVKNSSPILVPFHWSVFKSKATEKITIDEQHTHYRIEPSQGKIQPGQVVEFSVSFSPEHAEPYFEYCDLIVEDLPLPCIRQPPEGLKQFYEASLAAKSIAQARHPMPKYVGSNTQFMSIPLYSFTLIGQGNACQVAIDQPLAMLEGELFIGVEYRKRVRLLKQYKGSVRYTISMEDKSSQGLSVDLVAQGRSLSGSRNVIVGEMRDQDEVELELVVTSSACGL